MESRDAGRPSHRAWRRIVKKERRRRLRRKAAAERDADEERLRAALERSAGYLNSVEENEREQRERESREKEEHEQRERLWLEEEARAQKEWQLLQERKQRARQRQLEQEEKIRQEFEAKQEEIRKKQEEEKRKREEEIKRREELLKEIDDYIDNGIKTPEALREVIDSQPGKELCPFFTKTGACRYGDTCSRNHRRVCLSKVILVPGFYSHFSLEKNSAEYDTDVALEFESSETRQHFREFYKDVVPELESFGRIKTLKYCCNTEVHLRGNLYVEYQTEREAARAVRKLKGRWYAGRQLNCEFVNLKSWRSAVCGMAKCPKGRACNFLHTFKNPHDEYDIKSPPRWSKQTSTGQDPGSRRSEHRGKSKWEEPAGSEPEVTRNWRWSESPEPELSRTTDKRRRERVRRAKPPREKRRDQPGRLNTGDNESSSRRRRLHSRKRPELDEDGCPLNGRGSKSRSRKREGHADCSNGDERNYRTSGRTGKRDRQADRTRSRNREDSSKRRRAVRSGEKDGTRRTNSKWDKREPEESSSEVATSDSDSTIEIKTEGSERPKILPGRKDEWSTTDSESEEKSER